MKRWFPGAVASALLAGLLLAAAPASAAVTLSTPVELVGTGYWYDPGVTSLSYEVTRVGAIYHYVYSLTVPKGAISHFIVQASDNPNRLTSVTNPTITSDGKSYDWSNATFIDTYSSQNGNPGMPGSMWGIKFDNVAEILGDAARSATFEFFSERVPVWGDFYAKDGKAGGRGQNAVWNAGFGDSASAMRILVPDTKTTQPQLPEWNTLALALLGMPLAIARRRARR